MIQLSVIIPVYKVEKYLNQCVDSVIQQKIPNCEIILVDDGSPDGCPQICDSYREKYDFVKVVHKTNGGLSSTRNAGIEVAVGEYLMFMDSDDWWNPDVNMNLVLSEVAKCPETEMFLLTSLDYIEGKGYFKRKEHERISEIRTDSVEHYYSDLLANGNLEVSPNTKIIRREFLRQNGLFFKNGIVCEDSEWILRVLRVLQTVVILPEPLYCYRLGREGSISNMVGLRNLKDMLAIVASSLIFYSESENGERAKYELCYGAYLWFCALGLSNGLSKDEYREIKLRLVETASVCAYSNSPKTKASYMVYRLFGIGTARFVLGVYLKFKHCMNLNKKKQENA